MSVKPKILSSNNNQSPQISNTNMKKFDFSSNITIIQIWSGVCGVDQLPKLSRSILLLLIEPSSCIFPRFSTEKSHRHYWSWRIYRLWWQRHCHRPVRSILPRSTPLLLHWYRCCCHRHWHSRLRHEQCSIITGNDPMSLWIYLPSFDFFSFSIPTIFVALYCWKSYMNFVVPLYQALKNPI